MKSIVCGTPSWSEYYATWISCDGGSANSVLPMQVKMAPAKSSPADLKGSV
jgi:hypothetical protein